MTLETRKMTGDEVRDFKVWLDKNIGVDFEIVDLGEDVYSLTILDVTNKEIDLISEHENFIKGS